MTIKIINHKKVNIENIKIPCKCGCNNLIWKYDKKSRERLYCKGHFKVKINSWNRGRKNCFSEETLKKMRMAKLNKPSLLKGIKINDPKRIEQMRISQLNYWKDKKQSKESKRIKLKAKRLANKINFKVCCEICGSTNNLHKHHWRYDKPLLVNTLCITCHRIQHIKNFNESKYNTQEVLN